MKKTDMERYTVMVNALASFSKADKIHVGALVLKDGRIVSTGYNGHIPNKKHKKIIVDNHDISTIHAEMNAIVHCAKMGISTNDCELFVSHFPCQLCTKLAIMSGIKKIYYVNDYRNEDNPFYSDIEIEKVVF